jgi:hypothetical protein
MVNWLFSSQILNLMFYSSHAIMLSTTYFMRQVKAQTWLMKHRFDEMTLQLEPNIEYKSMMKTESKPVSWFNCK